MDFDTISVRGKSKPDPTTGAIVPPIYPVSYTHLTLPTKRIV